MLPFPHRVDILKNQPSDNEEIRKSILENFPRILATSES